MAEQKITSEQKRKNYCVSNKRNAEIRAKTIDPETGLTKAQLAAHKCAETKRKAGKNLSAIEKRKATMNEVMPCGKTRQQLSLEKRKATMMLTDENGVTKLQKNMLAVANAKRLSNGTWSGASKMIKTKIERGIYTCLADKQEYQIYRAAVGRITYCQDLQMLEHINKRGNYSKEDPYQLDHKYSIMQGFIDGIPPYIIGHICNLQMLPAKQNGSKKHRCSITKEQLFVLFFEAIKTHQ